jgi:O-antigen/teichoic acid export membrane protein
VVQNRLGFTAYGIFYALLNISYLFNMLLDMGMQNFTIREVTKEKGVLPTLFPNIIVLKFFGSIVYILITILIGWLLHFPSSQWFWLLGLSLNQCLIFFIAYFRSNIAAMQYYFLDSLLSITDKLLMLILLGLLLYFPPFQSFLSIPSFIFSQTLALGITFFIAFIAVRVLTDRIHFKFDLLQMRSIFKASLPYALLSFLMTIYFRADSILINLLNGPHENGIYAAAYRLLDMSIMFSYLFAILLLPMFSKLISDNHSVKNLVSISSRLLIPISILLPLTCWFYKNELFAFLYPQADTYSSLVMAIVLLSFPFISAMYIYGTLLTAKGQINWLNKVAFTAMILNLVLNTILIPLYQSKGAAIAAVITHAFMSLTCFLKSVLIFEIKIKWKDQLKLAFFFISSVLIFYFLNQQTGNRLLLLSASIGGCVLLLFSTNIIPLKRGWLFIQSIAERK